VTEKHDTDPLADTQDSGSGKGTGTATGTKKRDVRAGDVLGRYELVEEVGEGGMATVYKARDRELRREVAVKVLFPHLAKRDEIVRRFHREARAAAGLDHPNILKIFDVGGEGDDPPYIVMELVRGRSLLAEIEQRGPMLAELAACVGALLADALGAAHAAGVIHRYIKPANVMIAPGGRVLLADFGVARLETEDSLVTKTGALLGTPAYMSPEQSTGDTATAKSDVYSLGATLYQLSTGVLPYSGPPAKVLAQIAQGSLVPAVKRRANVGPDLSRAIDGMMQVEPSARPESAAAIAKELRGIAAELGDPAKELAEYFTDPGAYLRARTPGIVTTIVTAAERAVADDKLPRALALADRASALAPEDPAVTALIATVTEGGRAARRKRVIAIAGACVLVAGGATVGAMQLRGGATEAARDAAALVADVRAADPPDAELADAPPPVDAPLPPADAPLRRADAGLGRRLDAAIVPLEVDAGIEVDAAPAMLPPPDARELGSIVVKSDAWCNVTIDGQDHGRRSDAAIRIDAGRHTVTCKQPGTDLSWTGTINVPAGRSVTATAKLLHTVSVTLAVDATIDSVGYRRGMVVPLQIGRHHVVSGANDHWFDVREPCTVRAPDLDCYP
jgi:serine/threonine-protein kinase